MRVVNNNVLVYDETPPERIGSLYVPPSSTDAMVIRGTIVAVSEGVDLAVSVGEICQFNRHSTFPVVIEGKKYRVLPAKEILVIE